MTKWVLALISSVALSTAYAADGQKISLPDHRVAVISTGDLESASIGSYAVSVYADSELVDFKAGAVFARDGSIFTDNGQARVQLIDMTGDKQVEMVVSQLTAGSGNAMQIDVLSLGKNKVQLLASEQATSQNQKQVIQKLKKTLSKKSSH